MVHPIGIEVVTYISGRSDALVSVCILASLYAFLRIQEHLTWHLLCVLFLFAALLSKESAVVLPVIFCCIAWAFPNYRTKKHYSTAIALLCVCATYALYRLLYLESEGTGALSWIAYASTTDRLRTLPFTYGVPHGYYLLVAPNVVGRYTATPWDNMALHLAYIAHRKTYTNILANLDTAWLTPSTTHCCTANINSARALDLPTSHWTICSIGTSKNLAKSECR